MNELRVRDLMTPNVVTVRPDDTVSMAHELMLDNHFRHLVVVNEDGDLVGLLTHRDLLRYSLIERTELPLNMQQRARADPPEVREVEWRVGPPRPPERLRSRGDLA